MLDQAEKQEIRQAFAEARQKLGFEGKHLWLTYYLCAPPEKLEAAVPSLRTVGCINLADWDGGFMYPKQACAEHQEAMERQIGKVVELCVSGAVEVMNVDLDTSPNVQESKFHTLIRFDG
ncbi:MAG: hypothetical protein AAFW97_15775 [Pseudomonadota bacterium]